MIGQTISHYKIIDKLGEGGMGEVFLAQDTSLDRKVALKFLPDFMQDNRTAQRRFLREAKSAASLDHPFICKIYETGEEEGKSFISMEYMQGTTLKDKLTGGALALKEALEKATEIAEALEMAHKQGIVHRDLKPSNIMLTPDGHVKVMDFGLAKRLVPAEGVESQEQTLTASLTKTGATVGTPAYMSPEQLRGEEMDTRSDIFSFGVVLYEMLTGVHPFLKAQPMETGNAILNEAAAPLPEYLNQVPSLLQHTVRKMLAKEPERRYQHIGDVRIDLEELISEIAQSPVDATLAAAAKSKIDSVATGVPSRSLWRRTITAGLAAVVVFVSAGVAIWRLIPSSPPELRLPKRFVITPPLNAPIGGREGLDLVISPDGRHIVYPIGPPITTQMYLRPLDELITTPIQGTYPSQNAPIFSPDGESIAFVSAGQLQRVSLAGGPPMTLCDVKVGVWGGSWGPEDRIVFASVGGLYRVSAAGGEPEKLTTLEPEKGEVEYRQPEVLPGGKAVLFTILRVNSGFQIAVLSLETGEKKIVVEGGREAHYAPTGHLVYEAAGTGTLMAVAFDPASQEIMGKPVAILEGVSQDPGGAVDYSFSGDGTLVYVPARSAVESTLVWVDRQGEAQPVTEIRRDFHSPRLSPDGRRVAVTIGIPRGNIWIYDTARETLTLLTFEGFNHIPVWALDGKRLIFNSSRRGPRNIFWMLADGTGEAEQLSTGLENQIPSSWSPDGVLAYIQGVGADWDIWVLPLEGEQKPRKFIDNRFVQRHPQFSPDGRWMAFSSSRSGQHQVYVTPYPGPGSLVQISTDGGTEPVWARNGPELFYRSKDKMMSVSIETNPTFEASSPKLLFEGAYLQGYLPVWSNYDVDSEGRFLMVKEGEQGPRQVHVVLNWFEELKRLVPTD